MFWFALVFAGSALLAWVTGRDGYRALRHGYVRLSRVGDKRMYRRDAPGRFWLTAAVDIALFALGLAGIVYAVWRAIR